jgi:hypothetical protein
MTIFLVRFSSRGAWDPRQQGAKPIRATADSGLLPAGDCYFFTF